MSHYDYSRAVVSGLAPVIIGAAIAGAMLMGSIVLVIASVYKV